MTQKGRLCEDDAFDFGEKSYWANQIRESFPIIVNKFIFDLNIGGVTKYPWLLETTKTVCKAGIVLAENIINFSFTKRK